MKRAQFGLLLISTAALGDSCFLGCPDGNGNWSCFYQAPDQIEDAQQPFERMLERSQTVRPSAGTLITWQELRARYQAARTYAPAQVDVALLAARLGGSTTLATSSSARNAFAHAATIASSAASSRRAPTVETMHAIHVALGTTNPGRVRTAGMQVRAGDDAARQYLPGALVRAAIADTFDLLASPYAATLDTPTLAAIIDQRLVSIHPYTDGNGRVARLVADAILERDGFPPIVTTASAALHWKRANAVERTAHLERVTEGMRRSVELAESLV